MKTLKKFRKFRTHIDREGVEPISYREWLYGRIASRLNSETAKLAHKRGDYDTLNATLLSLWIGNQSGKGKAIHSLPPHELSKALREDRVRVVLDSTE